MKSLLKKFLTIFALSIFIPLHIENTCLGMEVESYNEQTSYDEYIKKFHYYSFTDFAIQLANPTIGEVTFLTENITKLINIHNSQAKRPHLAVVKIAIFNKNNDFICDYSIPYIFISGENSENVEKKYKK